MKIGFFTVWEDLPKGSGYGLWTPAYWLTIAVVLAGILLGRACITSQVRRAVRAEAAAGGRLKEGAPEAERPGDGRPNGSGGLTAEERAARRWLLFIPLFMVGMEVFKQSFLLLTGHFSVDRLPLHLCSLGPYVFLLAEGMPRRGLRQAFREIACVLILPGSLLALAMPDWTRFPVWDFFNLYGYLWHGLLVLYPSLILSLGLVRPRLRHIWYEVLFACAVIPPIYVFNKRFDTNYFFVNWPIRHTPLMALARLMGVPGYLAGYFGLMVLVVVIVYGIYGLLGRLKERRGKV